MKTFKHKTNGSTMTYKDGCLTTPIAKANGILSTRLD